MVEQVTLNHWVHGSSPCTPTIFQKAGSSRPFLFLLFPPLHEETVAQAWANAVWGKSEGAQRRDSCRKEGRYAGRTSVRPPAPHFPAPTFLSNGLSAKSDGREGAISGCLARKATGISPSASRLKEKRRGGATPLPKTKLQTSTKGRAGDAGDAGVPLRGDGRGAVQATSAAKNKPPTLQAPIMRPAGGSRPLIGSNL